MNNNSKQTINIGKVLYALRSNKIKRAKLETVQDNLWKEVHRGHSRRNELTSVARKIGACTNEIQKCISKLLRAHWKWDYATKLNTIDFLQNEIARKQRIVDHWSRTIRSVDSGRSTLIDSSGVTHTNTANAKEYVANCKNQIARNQRLIQKIRLA